jgi:membrane fusion protein (multidrug efflux system)
MFRLLPIRAAAVLLTCLALAACGAKPSKGPDPNAPADVGVVVARPESVPLKAELSGRTSAFLVSEVRPQVSGVIKARLFQEGSYVRAGQPLYQIDPATYRASLHSASAALAQAEATYTSARLKADRYKKLVTTGTVSGQANDDVQAAAQAAAANVQVQRALVEQARINLAYTQVIAPISGRIGKSVVTPGALVTANQPTPLATVQNLDKIYVDVTQSSSDLLKLRRELAAGSVDGPSSQAVQLILEDGSTYPIPGVLAFSDITVDQGTGSVGIRAVFPNPQGALLPGLYVKAQVSKGVAPDGILIPQAAISRNPKGQATAYVVDSANKAQLRELSVAQTVGDKWLVTAGLKPGERVIVEGLQKVRPGGAVKPALLGAKP